MDMETNGSIETEGETISFDIEADGEHAELVLPRALVEWLAAEGDTAPGVVADVAQFDFTRRIYEAAHHSEGDAEADVPAIEADARSVFEAHFGTSFENVIGKHERGHDHE